MYTLEDYTKLKMPEWYRQTVGLELSRWHKFPVTPKGTVLDLGAGCGETAYYYFQHGAERVLAVEYDPEALEMMKQNFPDAHVVPEDAQMVIIPAFVDNIKIDIDGGELGMILETHYPIHWKRIWAVPSQLLDCNQWKLTRRRLPFLNMRWKRH